MKKILSTFMVAILAFSLIGCNKTEKKQDSNDNQKTEESKDETEDGTNEETIEDVTFSDITYNSNDGTISVTAQNNTEYFIDSIHLYGTIDHHKTNGYGEDEVEEFKFTSYGSYGISISNDGLPPIYHLDTGEEKTFTFGLAIDDPATYSNPNINTDQNRITYRDKEYEGKANELIYYAMEDEYEIEIVNSTNGDIESITVKNTSEYQWEYLYVTYEYSEGSGLLVSDPSEGKLCTWQAYEYQMDKDASVTINFKTPYAGSDSPDELDYVTRILSVSFRPRQE